MLNAIWGISFQGIFLDIVFCREGDGSCHPACSWPLPAGQGCAHSGCFHCSREGLAAARISRKCGRVRQPAGSCPALPVHFPIQAHPGNLCGGPCGNPEVRPSREDRFTYTTNQNLLFENLKPLKARVEVRVGSYSRGPLGYTEGGGT